MNELDTTTSSETSEVGTNGRHGKVPTSEAAKLMVSKQPGQAKLSKEEANELIRQYVEQQRDSEEVATDILATRALLDLFDSMTPQVAFKIFCGQMMNVDKMLIGTDQDPTEKMLWTIVERAPQALWNAAASGENKEAFDNLCKRCRNWISILVRQNEAVKSLPALKLLLQLPLDDALVKKAGLTTAIKNLASSSSPEEVQTAAKAFETKYQKAFSMESTSSAPVAASPKLFGDGGALKLRTHKRVREHTSPPVEAPRTPEDSTDADEVGSVSEPVRKRMKPAKKVHWKPDAELVQVRFFEMDGIAKFKSSKNARLQEHDEGSAMHPHLEWSKPTLIRFEGVFDEQFRPLMSLKRGGMKTPESAEAQTQELREAMAPAKSPDGPNDSPAEPTPEDSAPDPSWRPRDGGKFAPATAPQEWLQKQNPAMGPNMVPPMNPMAPPPMMPPMMPSFPWNMNYPMNMGITPAQMSEFMKMNNGMFGKPSQ